MKMKFEVVNKLPVVINGSYDLFVIMYGRRFLREFNGSDELEEYERKYHKGDVEKYRNRRIEEIREAKGNVFLLLENDCFDEKVIEDVGGETCKNTRVCYKIEIEENMPRELDLILPEKMISKERAAEIRGDGIWGEDIPLPEKMSHNDIKNERKRSEDIGGTR